MGWGTGNLGGGSGGLNFKVVGYATEAELLADTPKENTIGVITQTAITSWAFSATEPAEPVAGMVWISTGDSSGVAFNALKKNAIQVYPLSAKQYVDGAWVDVTAMSYQGGEWAPLTTDIYIYKDGSFSKQAGEIKGVSTMYYDSIYSSNAKAPTVKNTNGVLSIALTASDGASGAAVTENAIDVTEYNTLTAIVASATAEETRNIYIGLYEKTVGLFSNSAAHVKFSSTVFNKVVTLDISQITGKKYVVIGMQGWNNNVTVKITELALLL